ncbi:putative protein O-GlcNAc transferase [Helianthus annuus]|nr:putative protein O-GlcNAc transferase [Helianthus annuus]
MLRSNRTHFERLSCASATFEVSPMGQNTFVKIGYLHEFDLCTAKNEDALLIKQKFVEYYGNMANALIRYLLSTMGIWPMLGRIPTKASLKKRGSSNLEDG